MGRGGETQPNLFYGLAQPRGQKIAIADLLTVLCKRHAKDPSKKPAYIGGTEIVKGKDGVLESIKINLFIPPDPEPYAIGQGINFQFSREVALLQAMDLFLIGLAYQIDRTQRNRWPLMTFERLKKVVDSKQIMVDHCTDREAYPEDKLGLPKGPLML